MNDDCNLHRKVLSHLRWWYGWEKLLLHHNSTSHNLHNTPEKCTKATSTENINWKHQHQRHKHPASCISITNLQHEAQSQYEIWSLKQPNARFCTCVSNACKDMTGVFVCEYNVHVCVFGLCITSKSCRHLGVDSSAYKGASSNHPTSTRSYCKW